MIKMMIMICECYKCDYENELEKKEKNNNNNDDDEIKNNGEFFLLKNQE